MVDLSEADQKARWLQAKQRYRDSTTDTMPPSVTKDLFAVLSTCYQQLRALE